ncbi:MAG: hypothetical protein RLZZ440_2124 [Planctomycetota bacterium]|jgi:membrane-bound ClpP family serine protease
MSPLLWIALLIVVGLALIMLEVFVPSGGVLGLLSVLALGAGVATAFVEHGAAAGMTVLAGTFLAVPAVLVAAFRWFPSTPLGRRVLPPPPGAEDVLPDLAVRRRLRELVGRRGRATVELLPWGRVELDGESFEAVSDGRPLAAGSAIEVTAVQGRSLVVRQAADHPSRSGLEPLTPAGASPDEPAAPRLSSLLEEFDFDEIRENSAPADELDSPPSANQA